MNWARAYFGLLIVTVGSLLALDNSGILDAGDVSATWWPAVLILGGLLSLAANRGHWLSALVLIGVGGALLARSTGLVDSIGGVMPILLIVLGVLVIAGKGFGSRHMTTANTVNCFNLFSGSEIASHSTSFEGGRVGAVFGGAEVDLRDASLATGANLDVFTAFGGVEVKVPEGWRVDIDGLPLFGGFENVTAREHVAADAPELHIDATVLFGGLEVKH